MIGRLFSPPLYTYGRQIIQNIVSYKIVAVVSPIDFVPTDDPLRTVPIAFGAHREILVLHPSNAREFQRNIFLQLEREINELRELLYPEKGFGGGFSLPNEYIPKDN